MLMVSLSWIPVEMVSDEDEVSFRAVSMGVCEARLMLARVGFLGWWWCTWRFLDLMLPQLASNMISRSLEPPPFLDMAGRFVSSHSPATYQAIDQACARLSPSVNGLTPMVFTKKSRRAARAGGRALVSVSE